LILSVCDPSKSGIEGNKCLPYYSETENWSQKYGALISLGGSYGHVFKPATILDLLKFDMVVVKDGVLGGNDETVYCHWQEGDCNYFKVVANSMTHTCLLQIKQVYKLNDNDLVAKRGEPNYDPAYKYDYLYKVLVHNTNAVIKYACTDQCSGKDLVRVEVL
jgi:hypothetical protein